MKMDRCRAVLRKSGLLLLLGILGASGVWGHEGSKDGAEQGPAVPAPITAAETCPCTFGPLIADTAVLIEKGRFAIQPLGLLRFTGGSFSQSWRRVSAGGDFVSLELPVKFTYGLAKNLEVYSVIAYRHNWAGQVQEPGPNGERAANFGGLGDINLTLKYQLLEESESRPTVTGLFSVGFPTGHNFPLNPGRLGTDVVGTGSYAFTLGLNLSKWLRPFILYGNLWYSTFTHSKEAVEQDGMGTEIRNIFPRDVLTFRLAAEYPMGGRGPWVGLLEFYSEWELGRVFGPRPNTPSAARLGILPGVEYVYSEKLAFALGVAIEVAGKNANFDYTPMFSVIYIF